MDALWSVSAHAVGMRETPTMDLLGWEKALLGARCKFQYVFRFRQLWSIAKSMPDCVNQDGGRARRRATLL